MRPHRTAPAVEHSPHFRAGANAQLANDPSCHQLRRGRRHRFGSVSSLPQCTGAARRGKVTTLAFLIKASAAALKAFPDLNASLSGGDIILKCYAHIGFAVDTPDGLVVPVIRNCDAKGVRDLGAEMSELAGRARVGKLAATEMQGGCFSISSLGGIGGTGFTPIINAPEVAILGAARSAMQPVWNGTEFKPRLMLPLCLSWDHRVIDGAMAARFLSHLSSLLSDLRRVGL